MTVHRIRMPDAFAGDEPREIVWDSDAGTLAGDHSCIDGPWGLRARLDELAAELAAAGDAPDRDDARPGIVGNDNMTGHWRVADPWRDPGDFLVVLLEVVGNKWDDNGLPEALRGVLERQPFHGSPIKPGTVA